MIICSNCGSINSESEGKFCRKCGALLPVSSKPPKMRVPFGKKEKKKEKESIKEKEVARKAVQEKERNKESSNSNSNKQQTKDFDLQEIPSEEEIFFTSQESNARKEKETSKEKEQKVNIGTFEDINESRGNNFLQEITPKAFSGSIIREKDVYGTRKARQKLEEKEKEREKEITQQVRGIPEAIERRDQKRADTQEVKKSEGGPLPSYEKRHKLEKDMRDVLQFISKKFQTKTVSKEKAVKNEAEILQKKTKTKIAPSSMNEILKELLKIDTMIEASAIIKEDGTILASALSERISDTLFVTIGQNLSMIGTDIIEGLSAGILRSISVRGTKGVIDLAPIDKSIPSIKDMLLIIFSNPKVKNGVINLSVNLVRRQIKNYLGIEK
jgi:predicted regulator of Ras-like GTPase activity (Roadblock/LC7/MglB family)